MHTTPPTDDRSRPGDPVDLDEHSGRRRRDTVTAILTVAVACAVVIAAVLVAGPALSS
ncbi:hypothetical protein OG216_14845 [Streptomycetaceae bacterium NBC_01309]